MKLTRLTAFLLVLVMLVSLLAGCGNTSQSESSGDSDVSSNSQVEESRTPELIDGKKLYEDALEAFKSIGSFKLSSEYSLSVEVGTESRNESGKSEETFLSYGEKDMAYYSESETVFGEDRTVQVKETLLDGVSYILYDDNGFYTNETVEHGVDFLTAELYSEIGVLADKDENGNTVIMFGAAEKIEPWLAPDYADAIDVSGEVCVGTDGNIVSLKYGAKFRQGAAYKEAEYSYKLEKLDESSLPEITKPEKLRTYKEIASIDAIAIFDEAVMNLSNLGTFSYKSRSQLNCNAIGSIQRSMSDYAVFNRGDDFVSEFSMEKYVLWLNLYGDQQWQEDYITNTTTIIDGTETAVINGLEKTTELTDEEIKKNYEAHRDTMNHWLPKLTEIKDVEIDSYDGYIVLKIKGTDSFGEDVREQMSDLLNNVSVVEEIVEGYEEKAIEITLTVDIDTLYPVAINVNYKGMHIYEGEEYELGLEQSVSIVPANPEIYYDITDEFHPDFDKEPEAEELAKPLFYKVTDADGNVMWLLGTIHLGDERTAYLPKEIYDAFDSADAAAFEIDVIALTEALELGKDKKLIELYYESNFYSDGKSITDDIEKDIYDSAKELFDNLALGTFGDNISNMDMVAVGKPNFWSSLLNNTYLEHSFALSMSKGVDLRLLARAKEDGMKIYEIEDSSRQYTMDIELSDYHKLNFEFAMECPRSEYSETYLEMFEAWCDGDLEALTALVNEPVDYTEMTEEEIAVYEKYEKLLTTDRDALMLEKAKEYLASGETVFYAVGLAHLLNEDTGLVKTLSDAGYTVELVEYK